MRCPDCNGPAGYSLFSGGREAHCDDLDGCGAEGDIEIFLETGEPEPRAALLRTSEGREELRTMMADHLAGL
jgi:hypothetical protein